MKKGQKLTTGKIRRELAILIEEKKKSCTTEKEENHAINMARKEINLKYGKDWRDKYNSDNQSYDKWWGECNMDGSFAYNGVTDDF
jgi:hypothetical protein